MAKDYKNAAIPFSGYLYQHLVGIELLGNWLDDPNLFEWVQFESDDDSNAKGLDDVVARRPDGSMLLWQVKFTVDPFSDDNFISWEWLLTKRPKGRSLIRKWFDALSSMRGSQIFEAALITNRLPDRSIDTCLDPSTGKLDVAKIQPAILEKLVDQVGTESDVKGLFSVLEFRHSHQGYVALDRTLQDRFIPRHTDRHGWLALCRESIAWAIRKRFPAPNGHISFPILEGVLSNRRPAPLSQSFRVPDGYDPPDGTFATSFIKKIADGQSNVAVLWGSPGQGKSTFLSYVCSQIDAQQLPYVRHHYFLELTDSSDRIAFRNIANSLMAQIEAKHADYVQGLSDQPEELRKWLEACGNGYLKKGKRFLVLVDGLDHVWRENEGSKRPLDSLFRHLLPVPTNVTLILGTQRVGEAQLPTQFATFVRPADWVELPRMSLTATKRWLAGQLDANRFEMADSNRGELTAIAEAFQRLSSGHPLLLTYAFESLARESRVLSVDTVDAFAIRPDGDVQRYYKSLWQRISSNTRDALHLMAGSRFIWPTFGLESCLDSDAACMSQEIGHLFQATEVGQVPFHGSLFVHIREESDHQSRTKELLPRVVHWLEAEAPAFLRWGWLWIYKARIGDSSDILRLTSRDWAIESLSKGYPKDQLVDVLTEAERIAFEKGLFGEAVRIRWLKVRILNGTEFQLDDYSRVYRCALFLTDDDYPRRLLAANLNSTTIERLHRLGEQYVSLGKIAEAVECQDTLRRRLNDRLAARAYQQQELRAHIELYLDLAAATAEFEPAKLLKSIQQFKGLSLNLFRFLLQRLAKREDLQSLTRFVSIPMRRDLRESLELACIRLAGRSRARLHEWPEFRRFVKHPISLCWTLIYSPSRARPINFSSTPAALRRQDLAGENDGSERYLHRLFFIALAKCLEAKGAAIRLENVAPEFHGDDSWLDVASEHLVRIANRLGSVLARGEVPTFATPYRLLDDLVPPEDFQKHRDYLAFRRAVMSLSCDVFMLTSIRSARVEILESDWAHLRESRHFHFSEWLDRQKLFERSIVPNEVLESVLQTELATISLSVSPFNDRANHYLEVCELAVERQLPDLARTALGRTIACVIGYGWRRDSTLSHVIAAVEALAPTEPAFALAALGRIGGIVSSIGDMTEDDAARESDLTDLLLALAPKAFVEYYAEFLRRSDWYNAELAFGKCLALSDLDSLMMGFATVAVTDSHAVSALNEKAKAGDANARAILDDNGKRFGRAGVALGRKRVASDTPIDEKYATDIRSFGPSDLTRLLTALKDEKAYLGESKAVREWFEYWHAQERGLEVVRAIRQFVEGENVPWTMSELLDRTFASSLNLEGNARAYPLLVAAQIHGQGWDALHSATKAQERFAIVASTYPEKWKEFIYESCKSPYKSAPEKLLIPHHRLVQFLVTVNQVGLAREVAESMISTVVEEFSDQPVPRPAWLGAI